MFSSNIQNLLNTSGKDAALQRAVQIKNYVNNINKPAFGSLSGVEAKPFEQVLKSSTASETNFRVANASEIQNASNAVGQKFSKSHILNIISQVSKKYDIDEKLVRALVRQESGFRHDAVSHCGAMGLMQLMPATAKGLGVTDPFDPVQNIEGGVKYLKSKLKRHNGNLILALAAYNAGSGNVDKYNGVPPFKETQNYVKSILAQYLG